MKKTWVSLLLALLLCALLAGCEKKGMETAVTKPARGKPAVPVVTEGEAPSELPYQPGQMGVYVVTDPELEAAPEVLDSVHFDLTDGAVELTRYPVSNCRHDLVKNGMQVGGFLLLDIPKEMLTEAADNFDGFKALAKFVGEQVLPEVYPDKAVIWGGGHTTGGDINCFVTVIFKMGDGEGKAQQIHRIYVGKTYCYDFWYDQTWFYDGGTAILKSLCAQDIRPEQNRDAQFHWTVEEIQEQGKFVF